MKKVLSVILAVALLCGTFAGLQITSHAENIAGGTLTLDEEVNVSLTGDDGKWFYFTPSEDGTYTFYTEGESDTRGYLYDSLDNFNDNVSIYDDDDSGNGYNFAITANLEAGTQYIILCKPYDGGAEFTLTVVSGEVDFGGGGESDLPESGQCGENVTYTFDSETGTLTISGTGEMYDPEFESSPFSGNNNIKNIVINNGVTNISNYAFKDCSALTGVTIPDSVTSIGEGAFYSCYDLTSVTIGSSVTSIDGSAFDGCTGLTSISVNPDNKYYDSRNNCNALIETASNTLITGCKNTVIPNTVTDIGECAFLDCDGFTSITIPDSVTTIGSMAFRGCSSLTSVTIPDSVASIAKDAFYCCSGLTSISVNPDNKYYDSRNNCNALIKTETNTLIAGCKNTVIPNTVTRIAKDAFHDCSGLTSINIPDSVAYIDNGAFSGCTGLTSVIIPDSVTSIGDAAFFDCYNLTDVYYAGTEEEWNKISIDDGNEGLTGATIHFNSTGGGGEEPGQPESGQCGENVTYTFDSGTGTLTISGTGDMYDYTYVNSPFDSKVIKTVVINNGVTSIGDGIFSDCYSLASVTIPDSVTSIGKNAFFDCIKLTSVTIPDSVTSIGDQAFYDCNISSVTIGTGVTSIGNGAFMYCEDITDVYYAGSEEEWNKISIDDGNDCLTNATIHYNSTGGGGEEPGLPGLPESGKCGENVTYTFDSGTGTLTISGTGDMYDYDIWYETPPFYNQSGITTVIINDGVTSIGDSAFYECSNLTEITIPDSVTSIGSYAFYNCTGLTSITIPDSVTCIGVYSFSECSNLTEITIPDSVTSIDSYAFQYCSRLTSITIPDSVTYIGGDAFTGTAYYKNESNWDNGVLYINNALIKAKDNLSGSYTIKNGTTCIACGAFSGCTGLTSIAIPDSVTSIAGSAFYNCTGLTSIAIPDSVTSIGGYTFYGCSSLTSITIPDSVTSIGESAFYGTAYYKNNLNWNNGTLYIGNALIEAYSNNIKNGTTCIADRAFDGCSSLTSITIPDSVTSIGDYTFFDCSSLTSVTIPNSITSIGYGAFDVCNNLTDIYYAGTESDWNNISIGNHNECLTNAAIHFNSGGSSGDDILYTISALAGTGGTVYLYKDGELAYSVNSADGTFTLEGVANGSYDVYVTCKFGVLTKVPEQLTVDGTQLSPVSDVYIAIGDVNGDGLVDVSDISSILLDGIYATSNADYDIDGSGAVDINDVSTVLLASNYGASAAKIG